MNKSRESFIENGSIKMKESFKHKGPRHEEIKFDE